MADTEYTSHPITACFPRMTTTAYAELKADIHVNGQQVPIVVIENQIIDGRHRYQACRELGILPKVVDATGDPFLLVQSLNLRRRHLTADQIAAFHQRIRRDHPALDKQLQMIEASARERQMGALKHGDTISRRSPETPTGNKGRTRDVVATLIGSTPTAVARVAQVAREHPDALPAIEAGKVTTKEVLRHGGSAKAKAAKTAGHRVARLATPEPPHRSPVLVARDSLSVTINKAVEWDEWRPYTFDTALRHLLEWQWALAPSLDDKRLILQSLTKHAEQYTERIRHDNEGEPR